MINIFGIWADADWPMIEIIRRDYNNSSHENLIEIARRFFNSPNFRQYVVILLVIGSNGEMHAYTREML